MSVFSNLTTQVSIPAEMIVSQVGSVIPKGTKRTVYRQQFNNNPTVTTTISTKPLTTGTASGVPLFPDNEYGQSQTSLYCDIQADQGRATWLDTRSASIQGRVVVQCTTAGTSPAIGYLRSSAYSFFDTLRIRSGVDVVEEIPEYGGIADLMISLQQDWAVRLGNANLYGFASPPTDTGCQGANIVAFGNGLAPTANASSTLSFDIPIMSGLFCGNDRFLNIGAIKKLQLEFQTANVLPITLVALGTGASQTANTYTVSLQDLWFQCDLIEVPSEAENEILSSLSNGVSYLHGTSFKSSQGGLNAGSGSYQTISYGMAVSSAKSLFTRFYEGGAPSLNASANGKYDSKNPNLTGIQFAFGSTKFPQSGQVNPLLYPAQTFRDLQLAIGNYNTTSYNSAIIPQNYCKLAQGGANSNTSTSLLTTQDMQWNLGSSYTSMAQFYWGMNLERVNKRGILSGMDLSTAKINLEMTIGNAITNAFTVYLYAMIDIVFVLDYNTGRLYSMS
jgi:hypothetical protein